MVQATAPQVNLTQKQQVQIGKAMSYILRHGAQKEGIMMRADGYIQLDDMLQVKSMKNHRVTPAMVDFIVANNDKKRY